METAAATTAGVMATAATAERRRPGRAGRTRRRRRRQRRRRADVRAADDGGGGGNQNTDGHPEHFLICGLLGVLRTPSHGPGRPAHAAADEALFDAGKQSDLLAALASQLRRPVEGRARWSDGRHLGVLTTRVGRAGAVPLATQGYPTTEVGREWKQRFEGAVEFQRDYDQPRAV